MNIFKKALFLIALFVIYSCNSNEDIIEKNPNSIHLINTDNGEILKDTSSNYSKIEIPQTNDPLVIRTYFKENTSWINLCKMISKPSKEDGFKPNVVYFDNKSLENMDKEKIIEILSTTYRPYFVFVTDSLTFNHWEKPILCIGLKDNIGKSFRVIPSEMWAVENNLSISNMDFDEFLGFTDSDGIYRGL